MIFGMDTDDQLNRVANGGSINISLSETEMEVRAWVIVSYAKKKWTKDNWQNNAVAIFAFF